MKPLTGEWVAKAEGDNAKIDGGRSVLSCSDSSATLAGTFKMPKAELSETPLIPLCQRGKQ